MLIVIVPLFTDLKKLEIVVDRQSRLGGFSVR